ncbi:hypothetical protein SAMN05428976_10389 [Clostridium sp. USBA 49]|uniref:hypothetical protein n=1 Tax=Clostridium sp. USBA 49 TaxID=1881060 RepID=UPI00099A2E58|nr:hypothetical protein [Clostridium sp. USBA 49]SKA78521.1 hypothetical protein SAMN05428976_10389 [Clostridium sp. USBA 49]
MRLYLNSIKRQMMPVLITSVIYVAALLLLIAYYNSNSMIYYKISPYEYASEPIDFFFGLIVSLPFAFGIFFMKKDNFLEYVPLRMSKGKYLFIQITSSIIMCFTMVFLVNVVGVTFSNVIADVIEVGDKPTLMGYLLGEMQMVNPIAFGIIWSLQKAFIGILICLFAQISALYIENLFLALLTPFVYVLLENFFTSILGLSKYSLTTTFVLNRLKPDAMKFSNICMGILVFITIIIITWVVLRGSYEREK